LVSPCFALELPDCYKAELKQIVRQAADNPVIVIATSIRDAIIAGQEPPLRGKRNEENIGIHVLRRADWHKELERVVKDPRFKERPDWVRILAYRNETVVRYNQLVREMLGEDMSVPFDTGDIITAKDRLSGIS
jgi:hypothetical protein